ncbi:2-dehydropantoate 2-reductase [Methanocella paludicola SANAE]|uniref:2-dehydropantoate 2-reductase n=1 Tax=Methanocella paludicola (strain DSM 17711 / JCM 13418 / NBRC 101707 / SANAE) TaxID=304371 RepID=D1Z210_METPS|nr:2-dehydropantoate 2-reductase [Methanocella paludicola]BAI62732.1 2-dehydropantoate 2-reductase [Methanocella paludicola SANAE]
MKISVVGAGALGTFYCAMLSSSGQDVTLVCREKDAAALSKGIQVTGAVEVSATPSIATSVPSSDLVLVTVKAYDVGDAVRGIKPKPGAIVVVIHNGLGPDEAAASIIGKGHVAVGVSYSGVTFMGPGNVRLAGYTETVLGSVEPEVATRLSVVREALEKAGLKARIAGDIRAAQWEKLYANIAINPVTAITGLNNGALLEVPELKALVANVVNEAAQVSKAMGIVTSVDPLENTYKVIRDTSGNRSSMLQDVTRRRRTEIDALNGKVCELGQKHGVPTPYNDTITSLIKGIEHKNMVRGQ